MGELFSKRDLQIIRKREMLYGDVKRSMAEWRALLDEWRWWSSNWRKFPGYFLGKVAVLGFDEFLDNYKIAKEGRPIYEKLSNCRTRAERIKAALEYERKERK